MSAAGAIIAAGGALVLVVLLWPASGTRWSLRPARGRRRSLSLRLPAEPVAAAAAAGFALAVGLAAAHAAAAALAAAVAAASVKVLLASRRWSAAAEGVARLAGALSNQATVAVTATDALRHAAPLVTGPVGEAASQMADDAETMGMDLAAERFAAAVPTATARSLANVVEVSAEGGGRWAETVAVLEAEAADAAATARLFHRQVAALMPTLALVVALGAGLVAGAAAAAAGVGAWLAGPQGGLLLLGGSAMLAAVGGRVVLPARAIARSGGQQ